MEPRIEKQQSRFRIEKLEERIAPAHIPIAVPQPAVDSPASEAGVPQRHSRFTFTDTETRHPGRIFE